MAFLFTGQGSQCRNMGLTLMESEPEFKASMQLCAKLLVSVMDRGLLEVIYGSCSSSESECKSEREHELLINQTRYAQPCLFAMEYSLAQLWKSKGVTVTLLDTVMGVKGFVRVMVFLLCLVIGEVRVRSTNLVFV